MATSKDNTPPVSFSPMEKNAINRLLEIAAAFKTSKSKKMKTASPLAQGKKCIAKGQKTTTGYYTTIVPCGLQELHAYIEAEDTSTYYIEKIDEAYNDHHSINYYAMSFPKPVRKREWHQSVVTKVEAEKVVIVSVPCFIEEEARNVHPDRVRAEIRNMYILTTKQLSKCASPASSKRKREMFTLTECERSYVVCVDPTPCLEELGKNLGISQETGTFVNISMGGGSDAGKIAQKGGWVMLYSEKVKPCAAGH